MLWELSAVAAICVSVGFWAAGPLLGERLRVTPTTVLMHGGTLLVALLQLLLTRLPLVSTHFQVGAREIGHAMTRFISRRW